MALRPLFGPCFRRRRGVERVALFWSENVKIKPIPERGVPWYLPITCQVQVALLAATLPPASSSSIPQSTKNFQSWCFFPLVKVQNFTCWGSGREKQILRTARHWAFLYGQTTSRNLYQLVGRDSSVGTAACYYPGGPEVDFQWGQHFPHPPDRPWGPLNLQYNGYRLFPKSKAAGAWHWPPNRIQRGG